MGFFSRLFSGYTEIKGNIFDIKEYHGDVLIKVLVTKDTIAKAFTGDVELERLRDHLVRVKVPKIKTESKAEQDKKKAMQEQIEQQKEIEMEKSRRIIEGRFRKRREAA